MSAAARRRTLVLNADFQPITTWPLSLLSAKEGIMAVLSDTAYVVEEWPEVFRSPSIEIHIPKVIALKNYVPVHASPKFCRKSVLLRDRFCCQYCGERFTSDELTFDHVIPKSAGGQTSWENILMACVPCNLAKRNTMPNYSGRRGRQAGGGMRPLKVPRQPTRAELLRSGLEFLEAETVADFQSYLYWDSELQS